MLSRSADLGKYDSEKHSFFQIWYFSAVIRKNFNSRTVSNCRERDKNYDTID